MPLQRSLVNSHSTDCHSGPYLQAAACITMDASVTHSRTASPGVGPAAVHDCHRHRCLTVDMYTNCLREICQMHRCVTVDMYTNWLSRICQTRRFVQRHVHELASENLWFELGIRTHRHTALLHSHCWAVTCSCSHTLLLSVLQPCIESRLWGMIARGKCKAGMQHYMGQTNT